MNFATDSASLPGLRSIVSTMALPTTAASANSPTAANCSGVEMPNPTATGSFVYFRRRRTRACASSRSEEHTSELQSHHDLVCRLLLEKKKKNDALK